MKSLESLVLKNRCNKAKQISTGFEIEIKFKISLHSVGEIKALFTYEASDEPIIDEEDHLKMIVSRNWIGCNRIRK